MCIRDRKKQNPDLKRNIKFDDGVMDLVLDIKLSDGQQWQKIRPETARAARRAPRVNDAGFQEELDPSAVESLLAGAGAGSGPATGANSTPMGGSSTSSSSSGSSTS